jgi:hypothetical protein
MESKQRYRNFLLSIKTDKAADIAKQRCGHIQTQVPNSIRYAVESVVGGGSPEAVLYIAISFVHDRYMGGFKLKFGGWTICGFSNIKDACEHTPSGAKQVFVVGDLPCQGKRKLAWGETGSKKRTLKELERDNQVLKEQLNDLVDKLRQAGEASKAMECNLVKQLKQAGEASKAREAASVQFLDGYLQGVASPLQHILEVLNKVELIVNPSSSKPTLKTMKEAFLRYHPDKQNSRHGADKDRGWSILVSEVVCRHLMRWKG